MKKEIIICIIIVILIILGNILTGSYTKNSVNLISEKLDEVKNEIVKDIDNVNSKDVLEKINLLESDWHVRNNLLAYFIEHDELEKVETSLIAVKSYVEVEEYGESISKIDESIFILKHIEKKYEVTLQNIF